MRSSLDTLQQGLKESQEQLSLAYGVKPKHFLLAISGGIDSVVLATLFHRAQLNFSIAHFDHGLRESSGEDAKFVASLAKQLGVAYLVEKAEPFIGQDNVEAWARDSRYSFLQRAREQTGADLIVTAHHQRDQAETVLLKLFAGKVDSPLSGISFHCPERLLFRPLLHMGKEVICEFAAELKLKYVEDETNSDIARSRNWIRSEVTSKIRDELNPQIDNSLARVAQYQQIDDSFLENEARLIAEQLGSSPLQSELLAVDPALSWRALRVIALSSCGEGARKISRQAYDRLLEMVRDRSPRARKVELGFGFECDCSQGRICFGRSKQECSEPVELSCPGTVRIDDFEVKATLVERKSSFLSEELEGYQFNEQFDARIIATKALIVRTRRDGDALRIAKRGTRKLKKMFQEQGLMLTLRDRIPIVECDGSILWVPGVARSEIAPVTAETATLLVLTCYKNSSN